MSLRKRREGGRRGPGHTLHPSLQKSALLNPPSLPSVLRNKGKPKGKGPSTAAARGDATPPGRRGPAGAPGSGPESSPPSLKPGTLPTAAAMDWDSLHSLGVSLGVHEDRALPAPIRDAVQHAEVLLALKAKAEANPPALPPLERLEAHERLSEQLQQAVGGLKAKLSSVHDEMEAVKADLRRAQGALVTERREAAAALVRAQAEATTKLLEAQHQHTLALAKHRQQAASPVQDTALTTPRSGDGGLPSPFPPSVSPSKAFEMIADLTKKHTKAQHAWLSQRLVTDTKHRRALEELQSSHAEEVKGLKEETWRLEDAVALLQRQLSEVAKEVTVATQRAETSRKRADAAEEHVLDLTSQLRKAEMKNVSLEHAVEAYKAHYAEAFGHDEGGGEADGADAGGDPPRLTADP